MLYRTRCNEWVKLYEEGMAARKIGDLYGVSGTAVHAALKRRGIECRTLSEAHTGRRHPHNAMARRKWSVKNERAFQQIDTEEKAYWLGFLMADGNVLTKVGKYRRHVVTLSLAEEDKHHVLAFREFLGTDYPVDERPSKNPKRQTTIGVRVISEPLAEDLIACGCVPRKTFVMPFPYDVVPWPLMRHLVRGFFDGDGTVTPFHRNRNDAKVSFTCASPDFVDGLVAIMLEAGIDHVNTWKANSKRAFEANINRQAEVRTFYEWVYRDAMVYLQRKKSRFEQLLAIDRNATA